MRIKDIYESSGLRPYTVINHNLSVHDAVVEMVNANVGVLYIINEFDIIGIFTKKDFIEKVLLTGRRASETRLGDVMTQEVVMADMNMPLESCLELMMKKQMKYLPVCENGKCFGVISFSDIVEHLLSHRDFMIEQLNRYITGSQFMPEADEVRDYSKAS